MQAYTGFAQATAAPHTFDTMVVSAMSGRQIYVFSHAGSSSHGNAKLRAMVPPPLNGFQMNHVQSFGTISKDADPSCTLHLELASVS